ncbi:uncharacterized protein LOC111241293 isoform X3 [Vigna radiata var. radiata]|uniref:Uncharacterized protein LOC111241293 isoform X3 n=1 Tax=Vigna radiata var. radiata TaxID=3916 RepID=A0A3Q0ETP2_VIGRR|nr:uncharacterized protein LOC111241293 isoform X3 [Vigna radiata var. radiata]
MTNHLVFCAFTVLALTCCLQVQAHASPSGSLIQHLSSLLKWRRSNSKTPQSDGNVLQFENGYVVLKEMILGSFLIGSVFLPKMVIAIISLVQYLLQPPSKGEFKGQDHKEFFLSIHTMAFQV